MKIMAFPRNFLALFAVVAVICLSEASARVSQKNSRASRHTASQAELLELLTPRPKDVDPDFDCSWRKYALQYAPQIQPLLTAVQLQELFDALQLQTLCNVSSVAEAMASYKGPPVNHAASGQPLRRPVRPAAGGQAGDTTVLIYVDAVNGNDQNNGSIGQPLKTIPAAVALSRTVRPAFVSVTLRAGTYYLAETIVLTPDDSNLEISAYDGETPVISGGVPLTLKWAAYNVTRNATWGPLYPNQNAVYAQCGSPTVPNKGPTPTWQGCQALCGADPTCNAWTWNGGQGAPWTNVCCFRTDMTFSLTPETGIYSQQKMPAKNIWVTTLPSTISAVPALQVNGQRATLARYPNANPELDLFPVGYITNPTTWLPSTWQGESYNYTVQLPADVTDPAKGIYINYTVGIGGACNRYTPPRGFWCSGDFGPQAWMPTAIDDRWQEMHLRSPSGINYTGGYLPNAPYKKAAGAVVHTWRPGHWYSWMFQVGADDDGAFSFDAGGNQGGEGADYAAEWWIENVFEELDAPNEYFFDAETNKLYLFYNTSSGAPPTDIVLPTLNTFFSLQGGQAYPVINVYFTGLTFTAGAPTFMEPRGQPSGGDWALERLGVLLLEGTESVIITACVFTRIDGNAVFLSGYNREASIISNEFSWLGQNAIASWGRSDDWDGTNGDQPRFTTIAGNFVHDVGIIQKQSSFYFQAETCQTLITGNICFNIPRAAINFEDGFGGGNEIVDNLLFNTCRESSDHGAFNSWDRMPYVTMVRDGVTPSAIPAFNNVHHNFIVANYAADGGCLDNDDGSSFYQIHHNFCVYGGHKSDFDGHSKQSFYNIHVYPSVYGATCVAILAQLLPMSGFEEVYVNNTCILSAAGQPFLTLDNDRQLPNNASQFTVISGGNTIYAPNASAVVQSATPMSFQQFQSLGYDHGSSISGDVPDAATIIGWAQQLLGDSSSS